ncbi:succinate dehydrogenase [Rhodophyticola porphyridii]|nr:succinate dehydrogenase [Rhodophyticola porphyridii]
MGDRDEQAPPASGADAAPVRLSTALRHVGFAMTLTTLAACNIAQGTADIIARDQARGVVNDVVAERFPGIDATPVTDCVIDNASAQEILIVAGAAVTGVTEQTSRTVSGILQRPDTVLCISRNALVSLEAFA